MTGTTYDAVGNPLTYNGFAMTWSGRQLKSMVKNGGQYSYSFTYNDEGIRTSKTSQGVKHTYILEGTRIVGEQFGVHLLLYLYDESGSPIGLQYRKTSYAAGVFDTYYFEKNVFGDIVGIYTADGTKIGTYKYDAWGNCTRTAASGTTALQKQIFNTYNPFRYRGYYYDVETALYYLQSRYYDPSTGRFINEDGYVSTGTGLLGLNMYAYCNNNPVMNVDPSGESIIGTILVVSTFTLMYGLVIFTPVYDSQVEAQSFSASDELVNSDDSTYIKRDNFQERSIWYDVEGSTSGLDTSGDVSVPCFPYLDAAVGLDRGQYTWDYFEMGGGIGKVSGSASLSPYNGIGFVASAESVYGTACLKIPIFGHTLRVGVSGTVGGIGAKCKIGSTTEFGLSFIGGGSVFVKWD